MTNNGKNKWWNFFKFKSNKDQNKPKMETLDHSFHSLYSRTNSEMHQRFITIPVMGKPKWWQFRKKRKYNKIYLRAENNISSMIKDYKEDIDWSLNGEVIINGERHIPYTRQIWLPHRDDNNNNNSNNNNNNNI